MDVVSCHKPGGADMVKSEAMQAAGSGSAFLTVQRRGAQAAGQHLGSSSIHVQQAACQFMPVLLQHLLQRLPHRTRHRK